MALQSLMTPTTEATASPEMSVGGSYLPSAGEAPRTTPGDRVPETASPDPVADSSTGGDLGLRSGVSAGVRQALSALDTPSSPIARGARVPPDAERQVVRGLMKGRR